MCTDCHPTNWLTPSLSLFLSLSLFYLPLLETSTLSLDVSPLPLTQAGYPVGYQRSHRRAVIRVSVGQGVSGPSRGSRPGGDAARLHGSRLARGVHSNGQPAPFKLSASVCRVTCASRGLPHVCWARGCRQTGAKRSCWALGGLGGETCAICMGDAARRRVVPDVSLSRRLASTQCFRRRRATSACARLAVRSLLIFLAQFAAPSWPRHARRPS